MATVTEHEVEAEERLKEIEAAEKEAAVAELEYNRAKMCAKNAKETYEDAVHHLRSVIRAAQNDADRPLLNGDAEPNNAWRRKGIGQLSLDAKIIEAMEEAGIKTLGKLADWGAEYQLTDIKGIGPAKATQIEDALATFWSEHPEYSAPAADETSDEESESEEE